MRVLGDELFRCLAVTVWFRAVVAEVILRVFSLELLLLLPILTGDG